MERGLLSDPQLAEHYDDVVWMYLFQDFSGSAADRAAERVAIRFGITTWPQHFLVDPYSLDVLADTGRRLETFRAAVERAEVTRRDAASNADDLAAADALAARLEGEVDVAEAERALEHADPVVRYRALEQLEERAPESILAAADRLLALPHDQTRFLVCELLARHRDGRARARLEELLRTPSGSRNPNVLRIRAATALAHCGDTDSVAALAPFAASGNWRNGLTGVAVDALAALAQRVPEAVPRAAEALRGAFPEPRADADAREQRACRALAERVHRALEKVLGETRPFPERFDAEARARLVDAWR